MSTRTFAFLLTAFVVSAQSKPAFAKDVKGSGTSVITNIVVTDSHQEGQNTVLTGHVTAELTGILVGTIEAEETAIVHPDGTEELHAVETFTGTANGVQGTLVIDESGTRDPDGIVRTKFKITDASGCLEGVRGKGTLESLNGVASYEIRLQFRH
jgi:hypothetical protein